MNLKLSQPSTNDRLKTTTPSTAKICLTTRKYQNCIPSKKTPASWTQLIILPSNNQDRKLSYSATHQCLSFRITCLIMCMMKIRALKSARCPPIWLKYQRSMRNMKSLLSLVLILSTSPLWNRTSWCLTCKRMSPFWTLTQSSTEPNTPKTKPCLTPSPRSKQMRRNGTPVLPKPSSKA